MNNLPEKILFYMKEKDVSYSQLAELTGLSKSSLQRYATGTTTKIPIEAISKIETALSLKKGTLMGWENVSSKYESPMITEDIVTFPVIGNVAAGYDNIALEDWSGETVEIPVSYLKGRNKNDFFVLSVKGDSMFPEYRENDKVLILKQCAMDYSGQVGVVIYGDENATLKRIEYKQGENWMRLVPINPNHPTKCITDEALEHCCVIGIPKFLIREIEQ